MQLKNRADAAGLLLDIIRPLKCRYSKGKARLLPGKTGAHYGKKSAAMEGFARVLWGLGPLFAGEPYEITGNACPAGQEGDMQEEIRQWKGICRQGILHGTDPSHQEYWGDVQDFDQKMVEMAAIVTAMMLNKKLLWDDFLPDQQQRIYEWLNQINGRGVHENNWRFFRILVNAMFCCFGLPANEERLKEDLELIESCYEGNGWYHDGSPGQLDYYIPFAMHYYGLIYAHFMAEKDPERSSRFKERAALFYRDFVYWFGADGKEIPFGRSLTYRFAHSAFFSAAAFAGTADVDYGVLKGLALGNLRRWMEMPIFDEAGILSIGYGYPNLFMSERYNAPGSPYWGLKAFLMLALPQDHPFWKAEEKSYPCQERKVLSHPHMLITRSKGNHVIAYTGGQYGKQFGSSQAKYEKFVYSNQFGFSVPRGNSLEEGAFDGTLAFSEENEDVYRMRQGGVKTLSVEKEAVSMTYSPMRGVEVKSTILPFGQWHVRIHEIETDRSIKLADGGFALGAEPDGEIVPGRTNGKYSLDMIKETENGIFASFPWGISGAVSLSGGEKELVIPFPNTNLFRNLTVLPTIRQTVPKGKSLMITAFLGAMPDGFSEAEKEVPSCTLEKGQAIIRCQGRTMKVDVE